jgi:hypothetical protein
VDCAGMMRLSLAHIEADMVVKVAVEEDVALEGIRGTTEHIVVRRTHGEHCRSYEDCDIPYMQEAGACY